MPTFLSDPTTMTYVILTIPALIAWWFVLKYQDRQRLLIALGCTLPVLLLTLCDTLVESRREICIRKTHEIVDAVNLGQKEQVLKQVSESFDYHGKYSKKALASLNLWDDARSHGVKFTAYDFDRAYMKESPGALSLGFQLKMSGPDVQLFFYIDAEFVQDADNEYRVRGFKLYLDPLKKGNGEEFKVPGMHY